MNDWTFTEVSLSEDGGLLHVPEEARDLLRDGLRDADADTPATLLGLEPGAFSALLAEAREGAVPVRFLPARRMGAQTTLRLSLAARPGGFTLTLADLSALLEGAPMLTPGLFPSLSHELRNPLSSVKMAVQALARNPDLTDRDRRRLTIAHREVRTLERLLWLVSEAGRDGEPHLENLAFAEALEEWVALIAPELEELGVTVRPDAAAPDTLLRMDRSRTRGVLAPLLLSVARTSAPAPLRLRVEAPSGELLLVHLDDVHSVIEPAALASAFTPFAFGPTRTTGLLLPALRAVMRAQGGDAEVLALPDGGVRYLLTFRQAGRQAGAR